MARLGHGPLRPPPFAHPRRRFSGELSLLDPLAWGSSPDLLAALHQGVERRRPAGFEKFDLTLLGMTLLSTDMAYAFCFFRRLNFLFVHIFNRSALVFVVVENSRPERPFSPGRPGGCLTRYVSLDEGVAF
jgi:hypothetical protein